MAQLSLSDNIPKAVGKVGKPGTGTQASRWDHEHPLDPNLMTQKLIIQKAGVEQGKRQTLNLVEGMGITLTIEEEGALDRLNATIAAHAQSHDHSLAADGTPIAVAGVPNLPASKITSLRLALARLPDGTLNYVLKGQGAGVDPVYGQVGHGELTGITADQHHAQLHKDAHKSGGGDAFALADLLDAVARVKVRKNSGVTDVGTRRRLNLIEGNNVTLTVADDPTDEEVDVTIASAGGGADHNLLSATHLDTLAASVVAGDIIIGNATPKWGRLAKGTDGQFLKLISGLPAWADPPAGADHNLLSTTHPDTLAASPVAGDLLFANTTPKWARLAVGANDKILKVVSGAPAWADPPVSVMDFWSDVDDLLTLKSAAGDQTLPNVVVSLPTGAVLIRAIAILMFGAVENTSSTGDNKVVAAGGSVQFKPSAGATWYTAIDLVASQWLTPKLSRESGRVQPGDNDVSGAGKVDGSGTYNFQFSTAALVLYDSLVLYDIQVGLRIWFR